MVVYIVLGLVIFTLVGFAFNMWESSSQTGQNVKDIVSPYMEFYPMLVLALAIAATVLVTYMERDKFAYFFAMTGFAVLLPDIYKFIFQNGRFDLALLGCALWAVIPLVWAFMWRHTAIVETSAWEKVVNALKTSFLTYPVYLLTAIVAIFGGGIWDIGENTLNNVANSVPDILMFILWTIWLFFLFNVIIVSLVFVVHDLVLQLFGYKRIAGPKGIRYEKIKPEAPEEKPKPKVNHYAGLIQEMQVFSKYMGQVDRIKAASTIGRFKNEYLTLAAKYNEESKADAEKMIKSIELEFMQKY